jgi:hypothetical protein
MRFSFEWIDKLMEKLRTDRNIKSLESSEKNVKWILFFPFSENKHTTYPRSL